jgi:hypothetical protein
MQSRANQSPPRNSLLMARKQGFFANRDPLVRFDRSSGRNFKRLRLNSLVDRAGNFFERAGKPVRRLGNLRFSSGTCVLGPVQRSRETIMGCGGASCHRMPYFADADSRCRTARVPHKTRCKEVLASPALRGQDSFPPWAVIQSLRAGCSRIIP